MQPHLTWLLVTTVTAVSTHQGLSQFTSGASGPDEIAAAPEDDPVADAPVDEGEDEPDPGTPDTPPALDWADPAPGAEIDPVTGLPRIVIDKQHGFRMILVNAGTFERGQHTTELSSANAQTHHIYSKHELPSHEVTLTEPYYLGEREVSQGEWFAVMGTRPAHHDAGDEYPIERVPRRTVLEFLVVTGYRLPTESEWEYACRADEVPMVYTSTTPELALADVAWFNGNSGNQTRRVAHREPNAWGFYDMHGNVSEFCSDIYDDGLYLEAKEHGAVDPRGAVRGKSWITRGSNFQSRFQECRPTLRIATRGGRQGLTGFRLARTP